MLSIERVSRTFSNGTTGFENIDLKVEKGEVIGILGTSGCGKSTLLRVLSGLDKQYDGQVVIDGETVHDVHKKIGMIFQEPRLMPWLKVYDNIGFGLQKKVQSKIAQYIKAVGLEGFENHYPKDLSGGMAQRVAIARALVTSPEILLLDEPFSALDAFTKMQLQDLLLNLWQTYQSTILLVTHDIDEALYLADRIIILRGQPGELYQEIKIEKSKPRSRGDKDLAALKDEILQLLDLSHSKAI
ncbi:MULTISPECIES: ABC transporter ATP-binding protein [Cytobacillus]|uniref:Nitrate/sulfonate/bicarbonate ABC transporter ATP-binding protein n=1 Tax=Cytobacillus kochii TaxID=859143 RepID=A0A248TDU8_9BACI|nr:MULTISPECIES: ABC transporter ATP-binding protein [Cytobacillus]ASV66398.1 nitrate/sulfonate/bicarbonate ABC transporter ATP-binding protein [Cytobacillus kochii]MEA1851479.1 ABC transporter ATP-binding protein [Cytobacillus sp. OWB-43]